MDKPLIYFDNRIAERSVRKGDLTQEDLDSFISTLPDRVDDAEPLDLEEEAKIAAPTPPAAGEPEVAPDVPGADTAGVDTIAAPPVETDIAEALASPAAEEETSGAGGEEIDAAKEGD